MDQSVILSQIAEAVDLRREEITRIQRVVGGLKGSTLQATAAVMALPMLYAHWEGFVKEALQLYVEFIEKQKLKPVDAHPIMYSFSIKKRLRGVIANASVDRMAEFAAWMISMGVRPLAFEDKSIETKSNLSYENLADVCATLRIDVQPLSSERRKINKLVHRRNNIAHTGRPLTVAEQTVEEDAKLTLDLIEAFEKILRDCIERKSFVSEHAA